MPSSGTHYNGADLVQFFLVKFCRLTDLVREGGAVLCPGKPLSGHRRCGKTPSAGLTKPSAAPRRRLLQDFGVMEGSCLLPCVQHYYGQWNHWKHFLVLVWSLDNNKKCAFYLKTKKCLKLETPQQPRTSSFSASAAWRLLVVFWRHATRESKG